MTRKCPSCAADVLDTAKFCIKCGNRMPPAAPSPTGSPLGGAPSPLSPAAPLAPSAPSPIAPTIPVAPAPPPPVTTTVVSSEPAVELAPVVVAPVVEVAPAVEVVPLVETTPTRIESGNSSATVGKPTESAPKSGGKGIIFGVIGVVVVGGAAFFFMSNKQAPAPATTPAPVSAPVVQAPAPVVAPKPVAPAPVAPKPIAIPAAPAPAPTSSGPDINKIMRDAANK